MKEKERTDDKITLNTKNLMRRDKLRGKETLKEKERIELSEIQKLLGGKSGRTYEISKWKIQEK